MGMPRLTCRCPKPSHVDIWETLFQISIVHVNLATPMSFYVYHVDLVLWTSTSLILLRRLLLIHMSSSRAKWVVSTACHRSN